MPVSDIRSRRASAQGLLDEIGREVARLPEATVRELAPVLLEAERELVRDLRIVFARIDGEDLFTAQQYRRAMVQIRGALAAVRSLEPALVGSLASGSHRAGRMATSHLMEEWARFSAMYEGTVTPIALQTASIIARGDKLLIPRYKTSAARYVGNVRDDLRRQLAVGVVKGETFTQLTHRLIRLGGPRGLVALRGVAGEPGARVELIGEGLFRRYRYWAERVARTEVIHSYNLQAQLGLEDAHEIDDGIRKRWDAAADRRVCLRCRELDGKTVEVDKQFPGGVDHPPVHPQCRCSQVAWHEEWGKKKAAPAAPAQTAPAPAAAAPPAGGQPPSGSSPPPSTPLAAPGRPIQHTAPEARLAQAVRPGASEAAAATTPEEFLRAAEPRDVRPLNPGEAGVNKSFRVTMEQGGQSMEAIYKPMWGEEPDLRDEIPVGTYHRREVAAAHLGNMFGVEVPATIARQVDGEMGMVQRWLDDAGKVPRFGEPVLERAASERLRVFDYAVGNTDRHMGNLLVRTAGAEYLPVAIDHGLCLPERAPRFSQWCVRLVAPHRGRLLPETLELIRRLDLKAVARSLAEDGMSRGTINGVLQRIVRMKQDARFLQVPENMYHLADTMKSHMADEGQGLSAAKQAQCARITDRALRNVGRG